MSFQVEYFSPIYRRWHRTEPEGPISYIGEPTLNEVAEQYAREIVIRRRPRALSESQIEDSREYFLEYWVRRKLQEAIPMNKSRCRFFDLDGRTIRVIHSDSLVCAVPKDDRIRSLIELHAKGGLSKALTEENEEESGTEDAICLCFLVIAALIYCAFTNQLQRNYA